MDHDENLRVVETRSYAAPSTRRCTRTDAHTVGECTDYTAPTCREAGHVAGCPGAAGGDHEIDGSGYARDATAAHHEWPVRVGLDSPAGAGASVEADRG